MQTGVLLKILAIPAILAIFTSIAMAGTGGGISPERHEMCMKYGKLAVQVISLKKAGYDQSSASAKLIGNHEAMRTPTLAKKIIDITRYVYSKSMSAENVSNNIYELCSSGRLDSM